MKGFKLDANGDVEIVKGQIQMISGSELISQTVQSVLGTNKGEWPLNPDEGISFQNIFGKMQIESSEDSFQDSNQYYEYQLDNLKSDVRDVADKLSQRLDGEL